MDQDRYKINGIEIFQPDKDVEYSWETTYTSDSTRAQNGEGHFTPLFTVRQYSYSASDIPAKEVAKILQIIDGGEPFIFHVWSPRDADWKDVKCYVGKGDNLSIRNLSKDYEICGLFSFNATVVNAND
jgi:hypothetical protein